MTKRAVFRQSDVTKIVKGLVAAGVPVDGFEFIVEDARLRVLPTSGARAQRPADEADDDWDRALGMK